MGLKFILIDIPLNEGRTRIRLNGTQKEIVVDHPIERVSAMWYKWQMTGDMIQDAFHELSSEQREFLITGITPHEWNEIFEEEKEFVVGVVGLGADHPNEKNIPNPQFCRSKDICGVTGKCEAIRKYDRSCND